MVLRTAPLFDQQDVKVINTHWLETESGIGNMFFVANDFGTTSDEEKRVLMEETAPARLQPYLTDADGAFDQALFDRRVFMVNAKEALAAQRAGATGDALEATGLPTLERAFHRILDEGEHLHIATEAAVARILLPSLAEVHTTLQRQRGRLDADAAAFEPAVREAEHRLRELTQKAHDLRTTLENAGRAIGDKASTHFHQSFLTRFITPLGRGAKPPWYADWDSLEFDSLLSLNNVSHAAISKPKRDALATEMQEQLQQYVLQRLEAWQEEVLTHLQPDIDAMIAETEVEVEGFILKLDEIQEFIADRSGVSDEFFVGMDERRTAKGAQILLSLTMLQPSMLLTASSPVNLGWEPIITRLVGDVITTMWAALLASFFMGPLGWVAFFGTLLGGRILMHKATRRVMMNRIRDKIGQQFGQVFSEKGPAIKAEIQTNLERQFTQLASQLQGTLSNELAAAKLNWDTAAEARPEGQAAVEKEITRLETIDSLLTAQFEELSRAVYGRVLTSEEQREQVDRFRLTTDGDDASR